MSQILSFVYTQVCKLESERAVGLEKFWEMSGMCLFVALLQPKFFLTTVIGAFSDTGNPLQEIQPLPATHYEAWVEF